MSDKPVKIILPKDPQQIGTTAEGQPIWFNPQDLIPTPDEDAERWEKTLDSRQLAILDKAAEVVLSRAAQFLEHTFLKTAPQSYIVEFMNGATPEQSIDAIEHAGYRIQQDGLKTVVTVKGKVLREMTAQCQPRWRDALARRVDRLVRKGGIECAKLN